jgi:hypothetical protein
LTADFQRVYGLRLVLAVETHDEDELLELVIWLPAASALHSCIEAKGDPTKARQLFGWDAQADLSLGIANLIAHQTFVLAQVNSQKRITEPEPITGPRASHKPRSNLNDAGGIARALLQAQKG